MSEYKCHNCGHEYNTDKPGCPDCAKKPSPINNWQNELMACLKRCIETEKACRANPCGWMSCGRQDTPQWRKYEVLRKAWKDVEAELWKLTDVEYDDQDPFRKAAWNWRYQKVMARKCCWYQKSVSTQTMASQLMRELDVAERELVEVCGLTDIYKSPNQYIEEAFPNLKKAFDESARCAIPKSHLTNPQTVL